MPNKTLEVMYADAYKSCPSRIKLKVSFEKAEKVVNPPQIPVAKNSRISGDIFVLSLSANTSPIVKQPKIFTPKVPKGKAERNFV